ncbi:MAG: response regulator [Bacteroidia bacterium]
MKKLNKIVFIDDDIPTNEYHKFIVKKADVARDSLFFTTAESALAYLSDISTKYDFPDLIFIDINMPGMSGHEFIDAVRGLPNFNNERTVLAYLATTMTNEDVAAFAANGMKYYYFKTITAVGMCKIVKEIFNIETAAKPVPVIDHRARRI